MASEGQGPPDWARREGVQPSGWRTGSADSPRVVVVGPCASGKTTLVTALRARGYDAHAVAQEHSGVPYLWQLSAPDLLVYLDIDLGATIRRRRREWSATLHATQHDRLAHAQANANLYLDSSALTPEEVAAAVEEFVRDRVERAGG